VARELGVEALTRDRRQREVIGCLWFCEQAGWLQRNYATDAVALEKNRLSHKRASSVIVYRKNTGEPVYGPIPPQVTHMLCTVPASRKGNTNERYFFRTGSHAPKTIPTDCRRTFRRSIRLASGCQSHNRGLPSIRR
jgi:hypothetical protein